MGSPMHVCFDYSAALQQGAGIGRYERELAPHLRAALRPDTLSLFRNDARRYPIPPCRADYPHVGVPWNNRMWRLRVAAHYVTRRHQDALLPGVDLFFAADHLLPRFRRVRSILAIHDLSFVLFPQHHTRFSRTYQRWMMPRFARHASHIVVPSRATERDVMAHYGVPAGRISVIPEGVDARFRHPVSDEDRRRVRDTYGLPHPYMLFVGTLEPRKNIGTLLDAFAGLLQAWDGAPIDLVLAGKPGWLYEPILAHITRRGLDERVRRVGYVADDDLPALYADALLFAFPSWYEGFGLPPLEAMACGTPVVSSNAGALAEIVDDAGLLIDPADTDAFTRALWEVAQRPDLRQRLSRAGAERAATFTWQHAAQHTAALCRLVMETP